MSSAHKATIKSLLSTASRPAPKHPRPKQAPSFLSQRLPTFTERQKRRAKKGLPLQKAPGVRNRQTSLNMHPLILSGKDLTARFNLRFVKKITVGVCYFMPWSINHGVISFYIACLKERQRVSRITENYILPIDMEFLPDYSKPTILIEYEDGRELRFDDASYMTPANVQELMFLKKIKIKRHKRLMGETVYDSEEEEPGEKMFPSEQA